MRPRADGLSRPLRIAELLSYPLPLIPVLTDFLERGGMPATPREWLTEGVMTAMIVAFILILRQARRRVETLEQMRRSLAQCLVHDLKSPVSSTIVSLTCLVEEEDLPEHARRLADIALRGCRSHLDMVETLADVDRLEDASLKAEPRPVELDAALLDAAQAVGSLAESYRVRLSRRPAPGLVALTDPLLTRRVIVNLVHNAVKYCRPGGQVVLEAVERDGEILVSVSDEGGGISPQHLGTLFQKYQRIDGPKQRLPGTGLGLYFCRLAVEACGGRIGVESKPGKGTRFWFTLPAAALPSGRAV